MEIINESGLKRSETFLKFMLRNVDTSRLTIIMKAFPFSRKKQIHYPTRDGLCEMNGNRIRITAAVNSNQTFPCEEAWPIRKHYICPTSFKWCKGSTLLKTPNEAMVWLLGHEARHFMCMAGLKEFDRESTANLYGFHWVRLYRKFYGHKSKAA